MSGDRLAAVPDSELQARLAAHYEHLLGVAATNIGFPAATDIDVAALAPFLRVKLNDPRLDGRYPIHSKRFETEACDMIANLVGVPADDRWAYVTSGATEGNEHGLYLARERFPASVAYVSAAAHPTIGTILDRLR